MATHHGLKELSGLHALCSPNVDRSDRFGRMLPQLPALYTDPQALNSIGNKNGPMEASGSALKTSSVPVGQVFFGQFIDHDITLDLSSSFARLDRSEDTTNFRTPSLDLDNVYGAGPDGSPYLYYNAQTGANKAYNGAKILTGADQPGATPLMQQDLARSAHGRAIIGDPRNDENRIVSQLQLGMIRFCNKVAEHVHTTKGLANADLYKEARRIVTWHYQWAVVNDYLKVMVGQPLVENILGCGRKIYRPENCQFGPGYGAEPFIPVEFSVAAYRFGHSMIPQRIQIQHGKPALDVFGPKLGPGFVPLADADAVVQWKQMLDLSDPAVDRTDKLDAIMAKDLLNLPFVGDNDVKSLATRNLLRGQAFRLPSGEKVAVACERTQTEIDAITAKAKALASSAIPPADINSGTPLWLYILIEAGEIGRETSPGTFEKGEGLGPVGGRIVAETLIGLMELDPNAYLGSNRSWSPATPTDKLGANGVFTLLQMLTF
jgi:hypothetical protein